MVPNLQAGLWLLPAAALASSMLTWACIGYAQRRGLLDHPGARRSHREVTPRGGGLAIVLTSLAGLLAIWSCGEIEPFRAVILALALGAVATVGFWDDHRALPAAPRLAVHLIAAALLVWPLKGVFPAQFALPVVLLLLVWLAAMVNFWNFIDGINGLAGVQAAWVCLAIGLYLASHGNTGMALWSVLLSAAILGFLPFNMPGARIFLGDVGSGFLGLAVGALMLFSWVDGNLGLPALVILPSAVLIDAGATLLLRMAAGRRWYTAHRSHLYQWLARRGRSHLQIVLMSLAWNLPTTALALTLGDREDGLAFAAAAAVYAAGLGGWLLARRQLRRDAASIA